MPHDTLYIISMNQQLPAIDLHYCVRIQEALDVLEKELYQMHSQAVSYVRIIYGIGSGALSRTVLQVLRTHPLIVDIYEEETGGSCVVRI